MKKSVKEIVEDLVQHIKDESPILPSDREKYSYDRGKWISQFGYSGNTHNHHLKDRDSFSKYIYKLHEIVN